MRNFTDLLTGMNRIALSGQGQMERGFQDFVATYRRKLGPAVARADCSAIDLLRYCATRGFQRLLQSVFCFGGGIQIPTNTSCDGIGHLFSDVISGVCAVILSYLVAHRVRIYGSASGPLLEEIMESHTRLVDLTELSEDMLWDDIGIVAEEEYRLQLYASLGYNLAGERSTSPEIRN